MPSHSVEKGRRLLAVCLLTLLTSVAWAGCTRSNAEPGLVTLTMASDGATLAILESLLNAYEEDRPGVQTFLVTTRRSDVIAALEAEDADAVLLLGKVGDPGLFQTILGQEGLAVIVHPDNTTADMSVEQVRAIFSGELVSWSELGGSQQPIEVIIEPEGSSTRSSLEALVLGGMEPAPSSRLAPDADTMAELVAATPGAIGWLPFSLVDLTVNLIAIDRVMPTPDNVHTRAYPFANAVVFASLEEPEGPLKDFLSWIMTPAGQVVVRRYLAPVRS